MKNKLELFLGCLTIGVMGAFAHFVDMPPVPFTLMNLFLIVYLNQDAKGRQDDGK